MTFDSRSLYKDYVLQGAISEWDHEVQTSKVDFLHDMVLSPDYHEDTLRNGNVQPLLLTRGGEKHSYNVICRPGDELFAGDIIDAFGQKWIVTEARADSTTHKTGIMRQCNKLFRFQNFTPEIIERWGCIDMSGYSSSINKDSQVQHVSEQLEIYLPYDADTEKIYIDKRLPSHIGYDKFGERVLFSFKVTGVNPVSESCNDGDHLLVLKAERFLYSQEKDNLDYEICDYIDPNDENIPVPLPKSALHCDVTGSKSIRIGGSRTYKAIFRDNDGNVVSDVPCEWFVSGDGASFVDVSGGIKVSVIDDASLIGGEISIIASSSDCSSPEFRVEVTSLV